MYSRIPVICKGALGLITSAVAFFAAQVHAAEQVINNPAPGWDQLWHTVIVDITVIGVIFSIVVVYFMFKYRRSEDNQVGKQPKLTAGMAIGWALIPAFIFMADDFYLAAKGWQLWNDYRNVPADRMEIQLESGMYSWDYTYPNGVQTQNQLFVPEGKPVMLKMTSRDTLHSHYIPEYRVKEDSMPGRVTYLWFYPKDKGEFVVTCTEYCGIMHSYMAGKVIVMPKGEFEQWYNQEAADLAANTDKKKEEV